MELSYVDESRNGVAGKAARNIANALRAGERASAAFLDRLAHLSAEVPPGQIERYSTRFDPPAGFTEQPIRYVFDFDQYWADLTSAALEESFTAVRS